MTHTHITENQYVDQSRSRARPWLIWGTSASFVLFQFFLQLSSGVLIDDLMQSFALTAFGASLIISAYYYIYVSLQTPAGLLMDRFSTRYILTFGALICSLGCLVFGSSQQIVWAIIGRLLMGGGAAFAFVGCVYSARQWFAPNRFSFMVGLIETVGMVGTLLGTVFLAELVSHIGWRHAMQACGLIGVALSAACYFIIKDKPISSSPTHSTQLSFYQRLRLIINNPGLWLNGFYNGIMFSSITVFSALWAIPFLRVEDGWDLSLATLACAMVFIGASLGSPIMGACYAHLGRPRPILMGTALLSTLILCSLLYTPVLPLPIVFAQFFFLGIACSGYVINFPLANDLAHPAARNTAIGFTNTIGLAVAPVLQPMIGLSLHQLATTHTVPGQAEHYTVHDFRIALTVLPILMLLSAVIAYFIPERKVLK